jgi:hypothetical protein
MSFGNIFERVKDALDGDDEQTINGREVLPASEDPYGDPADQEQAGYYPQNNGYGNAGYDPRFGNVAPASEDPMGDPADQEAGFGNVRPASEDPYGDPADQGNSHPNQGIVGNVLDRLFGGQR